MQSLLAQSSINLQSLGQNNSNFGTLTTLTLPTIISGLIRGAMVVAAVVFFFILVIGGIKWIASGGDKAATEGARNQITAALIGLVIVFAAWAIVSLIHIFFNVDIFNLALPTGY
jgi:hypothetical protein